jgi:D-serine deaminase-like pyridoxal phosphate-dependent protein
MNPPPDPAGGPPGPATTPPAALAALTGCGVDAIDTPAAVVDLDAMERNLARIADFARTRGLRWRPHAKMHKSAALARRQIQAGAVGVCVQKTAEAEALAAGGVSDIFISNEVLAPSKLRRVAALARALAARGGRLALAVDSLGGVQALAAAFAADGAGDEPATGLIDVFIEIDVGQGRCGLPPGPAAVVVARAVAAQPALRLAGLQAYHGRAQHLRSVAERRTAIAGAAEAVRQTRGPLEAAGLPVHRVTGAGTGTFALEAASGVWDELQPGSFLFMDADYARNEPDPAQPRFEPALFIRSQVISRGAAHAVCDAGHKCHAIDSGLPVVHPLPGQPALVFANGGDEHGILHPAEPGGALPQAGDGVWLVPGHCDPTVNLHDWLVGVRGGLAHGTVEQLIRVDARGALT